MDRRSFMKAAGAGVLAMVPAAGLLSSCSQGGGVIAGDPAVRKYQAIGQSDISFSYDTDVLIVGSGIAGLSAAMAPAQAGLKVMIMEREELLGGESYDSSGVFRICGTELQRAAGIDEDIMGIWEANKASYTESGLTKTEVAQAALQKAPEWFDLLAGEYGASFTDPASYADAGPSDAVVSAAGIGDMEKVMMPLRDALSQKGVTLTAKHECQTIIINDVGSIAGARFVAGEGVTSVDVKARAVVIAVGGYAANQRTVHAYLPNQEHLGCCSYLAQGDGLTLCSTAGAALADLEMPLLLTSDIPDATWWGLFAPVMNVGPAGVRIAREDDPFATASVCVARELGFWWSVFDNQIADTVASTSSAEASAKQAARLVGPCDSVEDLAGAMGVPADALKGTLESFNKKMKEGTDDEFGRVLQMKELAAPYYALKQFPARSRSCGGVSVDTECRVLDAAGVAIKNLYCCGAAAVGCIEGLSTCGASGYIAGCTVTADLTQEE